MSSEPAEYFCPVCKKPSEEGSEGFPFCSPRCRMIDLGCWLDESYRVSRPVTPLDDEALELLGRWEDELE